MNIIKVYLIIICLIFVACGAKSALSLYDDVSPDSDADSDADSDTDTDGDTDSDADADTDSDADSDTDADADADAGVEPLYWMLTLGGDTNDNYGTSIIETSDHNFVAAGTTGAFGNGNDHMWVVKLDRAGNILWQNTINDTSTVESIIEYNNSYIIVGESNDSVNGSSDITIIKFDVEGNILLQKTFSGYDYDSVSSIISTNDGGYLIAGSSYSFVNGYNDAILVKLDQNFNVLWQKSFGNENSYDYATSVIETGDGSIITIGSTNNANDTEIFIVKFDINGNIIWQKHFGNYFYSDDAFSVIESMDGNYVVVGASLFDTTHTDIVLVKFDINGNIIWQGAFGTDQYEGGRRIVEISLNNFVIAGTTANLITNYNNILLFKFNMETGNILWQKSIGSNEDNYIFYHLIKTSNNGIAFTGQLYDFDYYLSRMIVAKLNENGELNNDCYLINNAEISVIQTNFEPYDTDFSIRDSDGIIQDSYKDITASWAIPSYYCIEP